MMNSEQFGAGSRALLAALLTVPLVACAAGADDASQMEVESTRAALQPLQLSVLAGAVDQRATVDGVGASARFGNLYGVAAAANGKLSVVESLAVRIIDANAAVTTLRALPVYGSEDPDYPDPRGIALDSSGAVYVSNNNVYTVDKITTDGSISRVAGSLFHNGSPTDLNHQEGVAVDASGNLYIADTWADRVVKVAPSGVFTTLPEPAGGYSQPRGVAIDRDGNVLVADTGTFTVRKISASGVVSTIAGTPGVAGTTNGIGTAARFSSPSALSAALDGTVYVVDGTTIRKITPFGSVSTLVGVPGHSQLTLGALPASLHFPSGVAITPQGDLVITETVKNVVLVVRGAGPDCSAGQCSPHVLADFPACTNPELQATLAQACTAGESEVSLDTGALGAVSPPAIAVGQTYGLKLQTSAGQYGGTVKFTAPTTDEYLVYLGTPNVPFLADGASPTCSRYLSDSRVAAITGGTCEPFRGVYRLGQAQSGSEIRINLGEINPQHYVRLLVVPAHPAP